MPHHSALLLSLALLLGCPRTAGGPPDSPAPAPDPLPTYEGPRVVLVLIDGARYSETLGDPEATWVPELGALAAQGCAPGPIRNEGITTTPYGTASLHTSIWNAWADAGDDRDAHYRYPTHWEYLRASFDLPPERVLYLLPGYADATVWKPSYHEDYGPEFWPTIVNEGADDADVVDAAIEALDRWDPVFTMVYLPDVDSAGHSGSWERYTASVAEADRLVGELWRALEDRPAYAGRTVLLVTSDHGRHDDEHGGFDGHGCDCDGCREVTFLAVGPGIDPACSPTRTWELVDVLPTIGALQGWSPAHSEGLVMQEALLR